MPGAPDAMSGHAGIPATVPETDPSAVNAPAAGHPYGSHRRQPRRARLGDEGGGRGDRGARRRHHRADYRIVPFVTTPGASVSTAASFVTEVGAPGLTPV